ncbi:energy-coupling factor transporter transmembrane component T family protein [bacterium]
MENIQTYDQAAVSSLYIEGSSFIHKLDPRTKVLFLIFISIFSYFVKTIDLIVFFVAFSCLLVILSRISIITLLKHFKPILIFLIVTYIFHIFFTPKDLNDIKLIGITVSKTGIQTGNILVGRILFLILLSMLVPMTTQIMSLIFALEQIFGFLRIFGINVRTLSILLTFSLSLVPILFGHFDIVNTRLEKKGFNFKKGPFKHRYKSSLLTFRVFWRSLNKYIDALHLPKILPHDTHNLGITNKFTWRDTITFLIIPIFIIFL